MGTLGLTTVGRGKGGDPGVVLDCGCGDGEEEGVTVDGGVGVVATLNIVANCLIAAICSVPNAGKGDAGDGLRRAAVSSRAASVAASADEVAGITALCGKNSTERDMRSDRVLGI